MTSGAAGPSTWLTNNWNANQYSSVSAAPQGASSSGLSAKELRTAGAAMAIIGSVNSAIGTYYQYKSSQHQLKVQSQNEKFQAQIAQINARGAEFSAQQALIAGNQQIGRYTMEAGQRKGSAIAAMAARGGQGGVGSNREIIASMNLVRDIDKLTMNANNVRQAAAYRTQATNYRTQATMAGLSSQNYNLSANTINPLSGAAGSLVGSASTIAREWLQNEATRKQISDMTRMG